MANLTTIHGWAGLACLILAILIISMDWIPTALNRNIAGMSAQERLPSTLIHGTIGIAAALVNLYVLKWPILIVALWFSMVLVAAIRNWWVPYFANTYPGEITPATYRDHYAANITILPRFRGHPIIPDLQHTLIHLSLLLAWGLSWWSGLTA